MIEGEFNPNKVRKTTPEAEELLKSQYIASLSIAQRWAILEETRKRIYGDLYTFVPKDLKLTIIRGKRDVK